MMREKEPHITNIIGTSKRLGVIIDVFMLWLTVLDLCWLMFDAAYSTQTIRHFVDAYSPFDYSPIHQDFYFYDSFIVTIFIVEFVGRWAYAIHRQQYGKWFFYPFVHWYDVLGCFPTSSFRILRLLRIIGLTYRLHRWNVINLNNYALFNKLVEYYQVIMEETSDRVVVTVLTEAREEIQTGKPLVETVVKEVIAPKKDDLANALTTLIQSGIRQQYPQYQPLLESHIKEVVKEQVIRHKEDKNLARISLIGNQINTSLNTAVSEIVFGVIDKLIIDTSHQDQALMLQLVVKSVIDVLLEHELLRNKELTNQIVVEVIDLIITRVQVQKWREKNESS